MTANRLVYALYNWRDICYSGINSAAEELICKGRDRQYGVYSMLAVVITTYLYLQDSHHRLCALCARKGPSSVDHLSGC